jgi:hypothetical protein
VPEPFPPITLPPALPVKADMPSLSVPEPPIAWNDVPVLSIPEPPSAVVRANSPAPEPKPLEPPPVVPSIWKRAGVGPVRVGERDLQLDEVVHLVGGSTGNPSTPSLTTGCQSCGGSGAGCNECEPYPRTGFASRLVGGVYDALCCPDPCYKPQWMPLADTAFFSDSPRPVSQMRVRWQYGRFVRFPDRAEYFWARADGNGKGPSPVAAVGIPRVDYHEISQYTETAAGPGFSAFVITPYRSVNPTFSDPPSAAGFSDISLGTKSVLFDSELFLLTMQFKTTLPVGNTRKGLGAGHVSLEPSLLFGLRTSPDTYIQGQIAEWIPIAGDPTYSGALLHYHLAFNQVLWRPIQPVQVVGTLELHGFSFQDGGYTDPDGGFRKASGTNILQLGSGFRMFFCDKYDFGVGTNFGITGKNSVQDEYRFEFRMRY